MTPAPTYVRASDGLLYANPVLADAGDNWYLRFDAEDPPEVVWRMAEDTQPNAPPAWLLQTLDVTLLRMASPGWRLYPGDGWEAFVILSKPISADAILQHEGRAASRVGKGCYYDF